MSIHIKIGTRGSKLALWQAEHVAQQLQVHGASTEIITIETKGDKILNQSLAQIGSKGLFTEEIEEQLFEGKIDIAVHSAKDMQSTLPDGLEIVAFMERERPNDVFVSLDKNITLTNSKAKIVVGTSSARRKAILRNRYPHIEIVESRGNLQTRIRKMEEGQYQAMILAYAGMHRMGYDELIREVLPLEEFTPAVGQGSVAIESTTALATEKRNIIIQALQHEPTSICLRAERALLRTLEGGCSIPLFALAHIENDLLHIQAGVIHTDGTQVIKNQTTGGVDTPELVGEQLAQALIAQGAIELLNQIKSK